MNKVALVERLLAAEAEVDLADKEGEYMQCMSSRQEQQAGAAGRSRGRSGGNVAGGRGGGEPAQLISQLVPTLTTPPAPATSPFCHPQATRRCTWRRATCTPTPSLRCSREGQTRSRRTARGAGGCCPGGGLSTGGCAQISRTACCRVPPARLTTLTFTPPLVQPSGPCGGAAQFAAPGQPYAGAAAHGAGECHPAAHGWVPGLRGPDVGKLGKRERPRLLLLRCNCVLGWWLFLVQ